MVKGVLLSPTGEPEIVDVQKDYRDVKRLLEIESPVTIVERCIGGKYFDLWVDDEGLFKQEKDETILACGVCDNAQEILAGKILIVNHNGEEMASLTDEDIELIYANLKRINRDFVTVSYETSIGLLDMKFVKEGAILKYSV